MYYETIASRWIEKLACPVVEIPDLSDIALSAPNQRVIRYDCERTRSSLDVFRNDKVRKSMEALLTLYCTSENVKYKQGMNEVLAPFVYLKLVNVIADWSLVYTLFKKFVDKFLSSILKDDDFDFIQKACVCFRTLVRYHAPSLASKLDTAGILPELYVMPWFMTLFAAKLQLPVVFNFWDAYIEKDDSTLFAFIGLSLMLGSVDELETSERIELPEKLTKLSFSDDSVAQIFRRAEILKSHTPQDMIALLTLSDRSVFVPQLPQKIVPMYATVSQVFGNKDENKRFLVLDTRPQSAVLEHKCGSLPESITVPFDLEAITKGRSKFPVCEVYKMIANALKVDISTRAPVWPLQVHICILSDEKRRLVKRDYSNMLFLCLTKYCNIPRVSILRGGYEALHSVIRNRLKNHDSKICFFCNNRSLLDSSSDSD
jgi:hypothetical protein